MNAQNGCSFDIPIILNSLDCERNVCKIIKSGKGIFSMRILNAYVFNDKRKTVRQCVFLNVV